MVDGNNMKRKRNLILQPVLKWAGGKRQLLPQLEKFFPKKNITAYYEPFIGGGAVLFHLQPKKAVINDYNEDLINLYRCIKDNLDELIEIAEVLAAGFPHVRVDFYRMDTGKLLFGEMTFTSFSGICQWNPNYTDLMLGQLFTYPGMPE